MMESRIGACSDIYLLGILCYASQQSRGRAMARLQMWSDGMGLFVHRRWIFDRPWMIKVMFSVRVIGFGMSVQN
ncbi:hypothetical protein V6N13_025609 [Hibiscus sabdariffa]